MSETDVIRAFLDGGNLSEAILRTNGKQLFSDGRLIAEKCEGKVRVVENAVGLMDPEHRILLRDFVEWREQRAKVLQRLLSAKELLAAARANGWVSNARSMPARQRGEA